MVSDSELFEIFKKIESREMTTVDAEKKIQESRKAGRKKGSITRRKKEDYHIVLMIWVAYSDSGKIDKMKLRSLLAEALCKSESEIGRMIARINRFADNHYIGKWLTPENNLVILALRRNELRLLQMWKSLGISEFCPVRLKDMGDTY